MMMHPILEQVKEVLGDRIRIIKVDVDKYGVAASQYGIQSVPTLMLFRRGEVLWRTSGVMQKSELLATIDPFLRQQRRTLQISLQVCPHVHGQERNNKNGIGTLFCTESGKGIS